MSDVADKKKLSEINTEEDIPVLTQEELDSKYSPEGLEAFRQMGEEIDAALEKARADRNAQKS